MGHLFAQSRQIELILYVVFVHLKSEAYDVRLRGPRRSPPIWALLVDTIPYPFSSIPSRSLPFAFFPKRRLVSHLAIEFVSFQTAEPGYPRDLLVAAHRSRRHRRCPSDVYPNRIGALSPPTSSSVRPNGKSTLRHAEMISMRGRRSCTCTRRAVSRALAYFRVHCTSAFVYTSSTHYKFMIYLHPFLAPFQSEELVLAL